MYSANDVAFELGQATTEETKVPLYDKVFLHYADALRNITAEISAAKPPAGKKVQSQISQQDLRVLEGLEEYINYAKLEKTIERNLMFIDSQEKKMQLAGKH